MSDLQPAGDQAPRKPPTDSGLFAPPAPKRTGFPTVAWVVAGLVVLIVLGVLLVAGHRKPPAPGNTLQPIAAYAANLVISQPAMSEATNLSGGKYTYIDGHIKNTGTQTVAGVTVQVVFRNDVNLPPQIETVPLALIRTREPYVDTRPVSAAPLKPGDEREFRLTFETMPVNWNYQMPEIRITGVTTK
jgi:hypothetical protein